MRKFYTIILNPVAGKGKARAMIPVIKQYLTSNDLQHRIIYTEYPGHAKELAAECARKNNCIIVAAGGDGTCNEAANGILSLSLPDAPLLTVLPIGSGNDFSFGTGLPMNLPESLELLKGGNSKYVDAGIVQVDDREPVYFINGAGLGFDARVTIEAGKMKYLKGAFGYMYGALKMLMLFPPPPEITITINDESFTASPHQVSCMIGKRLGGSFLMAPNGDNQDGLFDVYVTQQEQRLKMIRDLMKFKKGKQDSLDDTRFFRTSVLSVTSAGGGLAVHVDGETISTNGSSLHVQCLPGVLKVLC